MNDEELLDDDIELCYECNMTLEIGQVVVEYGGELFCDLDCVTEWLLWEHRGKIKQITYGGNNDE